MDVLLRHTLLGEWLHYAGLSHPGHTEEHDPGLLKRLNTPQEAQVHSALPDEGTSLLARGEENHDSRALLVDWYSEDDDDVCLFVLHMKYNVLMISDPCELAECDQVGSHRGSMRCYRRYVHRLSILVGMH